MREFCPFFLLIITIIIIIIDGAIIRFNYTTRRGIVIAVNLRPTPSIIQYTHVNICMHLNKVCVNFKMTMFILLMLTLGELLICAS